MNRSTLVGLAAIVLWSVTVALARHLSEQLGPLTAGCAVYLAAGTLLLVLHVVRGQHLPRPGALPRLFLFGCGALFVAYTLLLFLALAAARDRSQAIEVGLLNYLWPALTLLFSLGLLGNRAGIGFVPGTLMALAGIVLVMTPDGSVSLTDLGSNLRSNPTAYGLGALAAVAWALYSNLSRRWGTPESGGAVQLFLLATGAAFGLLRLARPEASRWGCGALVEIALLALATGLAYLFWDVAMREGDLVLVASCSYLTPLLSTALSCAILSVRPGPALWLGCLCIMAGSFLSWRSIGPPLSDASGAPSPGASA